MWTIKGSINENPEISLSSRNNPEMSQRSSDLPMVSNAEPMKMKELLSYADEECKQLWDDLDLGYVNPRGHLLLRKEISGMYSVPAENVLVCAPQEGVMIGTRTLVKYCQKKFNEKTVKVVALFPAYQSLLQHFVTLGCDVTHWKGNFTSTGWTFDVEELKKVIKEDTRILMINIPHNPTGYVSDEDEWNQIFQVARDNNLMVFCDELYRGSRHDGTTLPSAAATYENAVPLSGVSKVYGLPGIRMGWLCSQNKDIIDQVELFKDYTSFCPPAPSEILALICLRNRDKLIKRTMDIVKPNLDILDKFFKDHSGIFEYYRPRACTITLVRVKAEAMAALGQKDTKGFCEVIRQEAEVMVTPSEIYDIPGEYIRIGFGGRDLFGAVEALRGYFAKKGLK